MIKYHRFTVEGLGQFPVDMLRYDGCYPRDAESAVSISVCDRCSQTIIKEARRVKLIGLDPPTVKRWNSFR